MKVLRRFSMLPELVTGNYIQRFYTSAGTQQVEKGFQVLLDNRPTYTPEKQAFVLQSQLLALSIAQEWQYQEKFILKKRMPLMNLSAKALDLPITKQRAQIKLGVIEIFKNDSLCFREDNISLREQQEKVFEPIVKHLKNKYSIEMPVVFGLSEPDYPQESLENFERFFDSQNSFFVVALEAAAGTSRSVAIALALFDGIITAKEAVNCSRIEDNLQAEEFGKVEGVHDVNDAYELMIMTAAKNLVSLSGGDSKI